MASPDIRNTAKPNQIAQDQSGYNGGEIQANSPWDRPAPTSGGSPQIDPYSAQMLGGSAAGSSDHNSEWLKPSNPD